MQIVICDDLKNERDILREHIHSYSRIELLDYVIEEFENAESLLLAIENKKISPDILFMDIYMDGITGIDAVKLLKEKGFTGVIIFTTTSESHSIDSYRLMADGYLLKPYTKTEFNQFFKKAVGNYVENYKIISFPCDRIEYQMFQKDLEFVETQNRGSLIHGKGVAMRTTMTIAEFAKKLTPEECFLQSHRGCIVNMNYVAKVEEDHILMKNGKKAPLTLRDRASIKKSVSDYFFLKMREEK